MEGSIFVGFDVEEVCAADGECAVLVGELDHLLGRVGGVAGGDACGVAVFVWDHVAFLELAECGPFPGAPILVGDVLVIVVGAHVPRGRVVCSCHYVPLFLLSVFGVFAFLAARVSASRLSLRVFSSLRFNSVKISKRPPGFAFPGGRLFFLRCVAFSPLLRPIVSLSRRRGAAPCAVLPPGTCFVRCRGRPDCSRGAGRRRLLRGLRRPRFRRGIVRRRRCC